MKTISILDEDILHWDSLEDNNSELYDWNIILREPVHHLLTDMDTLYESLRRAEKGTIWKESVMKYSNRFLPKLTELQTKLEDRSYVPKSGNEFLINERGRIRAITGQCVEDRVVSHAVNDFVLIPAVRPSLIYDNTASLKGRGVDMARRRIKAHLQRYYQREGTNVGYIQLKDQSKYYDNIPHNILYNQLLCFTQDDMALWLVRLQLDASAIDVSYMTTEEYQYAMTHKFDRLQYRSEHHNKDGNLYLRKGLNVGDQFSQTAGIMFPYRVDQLAKTVLGSQYYARYMDDSYDIDKDIDILRKRARHIDEAATEIGMYTNTKKTQICRLDQGFVYMQRFVRLNSNGSVTMRVLPKAVTRLKRRIKKLKTKDIPVSEIVNMVKSWVGGRINELSYRQIRTIELLMLEQFGENVYKDIYAFDTKHKR